jgi:hypothetical protein
MSYQWHIPRAIFDTEINAAVMRSQRRGEASHWTPEPRGNRPPPCGRLTGTSKAGWYKIKNHASIWRLLGAVSLRAPEEGVGLCNQLDQVLPVQLRKGLQGPAALSDRNAAVTHRLNRGRHLD